MSLICRKYDFLLNIFLLIYAVLNLIFSKNKHVPYYRVQKCPVYSVMINYHLLIIVRRTNV